MSDFDGGRSKTPHPDCAGMLWVVATPLGNPEDLSQRAKDILGRAGMVLAEDTRRAGSLFARLGIRAGKFVSFYEHNEEARLPKVLAFLEQGGEAAVVSDAGTPLLSDPGYRLVRACREAGIRVCPVPGPSAPVAALSASGLPPHPFTFLGFLPRKTSDMKKVFERHGRTGCTLVFFERKTRLAKTLALAAETLGDRECVIARELTKTHEEFLRGGLVELSEAEPELLGEITVVVGPGEAERASRSEVERLLAREAAAGDGPRETARRVAARAEGWTARDVYELRRELKETR